jgi:hypothetical protein
MSNNRTREISSFNDLNVQLDMIEQRMPRSNVYSARREDGKGGRIAAAANNVTMVSINISLSDPAAQSASHNKAMVDFPKLYHKAMKGSKFDAEDRGRLDKLVAKHRESLNLGDRAAFDRVFDAFNQSWGGKDFGDKDWDRFYKKTASLAHVPVPAAPVPAPAQPAAATAAQPVAAAAVPVSGELSRYFDKYYLGTSFVGPSLYSNQDRANKVLEDLNRT